MLLARSSGFLVFGVAFCFRYDFGLGGGGGEPVFRLVLLFELDIFSFLSSG